MQVPSGFSYGTKKHMDSTVAWWVRRHGKELANGSADTAKNADAAVKKAIGELLVETGKKVMDRSRIQMVMKRYLVKRPYLVSHVFKGALTGMPVSEIALTATDGEQDWHDREEKRCGFAWPLSKHHSVKPAREAAEHVISLLRQLGVTDKKKLLAYARKHIGPAFEQGADLNGVEEMDAIAEKAKAEDDARAAKGRA